MVEYFAVVLHQLNNLIECFTPKQFLCLATILQWTVEQQLFAVLLKPSQLQTDIHHYLQYCIHLQWYSNLHINVHIMQNYTTNTWLITAPSVHWNCLLDECDRKDNYSQSFRTQSRNKWLLFVELNFPKASQPTRHFIFQTKASFKHLFKARA